MSSFRASISSDPSSVHAPESNRYHLFVSYACPWAHRTLITLYLKHLDPHISYSVVHWHLGSNGWRFGYANERAESPEIAIAPEAVAGAHYLRDVYFKAEPGYDARFTVPVLWDKKQNTIVNNESSEIIRMMYHEFDSLLKDGDEAKGKTFYKEQDREKIDELNEWIYDKINNGGLILVYHNGLCFGG